MCRTFGADLYKKVMIQIFVDTSIRNRTIFSKLALLPCASIITYVLFLP